MERNVTIKLIFIFLVNLLIVTNILGQEKTNPYFNYRNQKTGRLIKLDYFLSVKSDFQTEKCLSASGVFKFRVDAGGSVVDIEVKGNLPDTLVNLIKKKIHSTNGYWKFTDLERVSSKSKWFVYPVYVEYLLSDNCKIEVDKSYYWLSELFDKSNPIINTPTAYLIRPNIYTAIK